MRVRRRVSDEGVDHGAALFAGCAGDEDLADGHDCCGWDSTGVG